MSPEITSISIEPTLPDGVFWPRITIVTPSYNQANYLEETIQSVLSQDYPNLEYIIIDGASTDGSVEIIKKYANSLAYWISEPDDGQVDAITKGMSRATGDIVNWLNADDYLCPGALENIALAWVKLGRAKCVICASGYYLDDYSKSSILSSVRPVTEKILPMSPPFMGGIQASWFLSKDAWLSVGGLNPSLNYTMDTDLYYRCNQAGIAFYPIVDAIAVYRKHGDTKTIRGWRESIRYKYQFYFGWLAKLPESERRIYAPRVRRNIFGYYKQSISRSDGFITRLYKILRAITLYPEALFTPYQLKELADLLF